MFLSTCIRSSHVEETSLGSLEPSKPGLSKLEREQSKLGRVQSKLGQESIPEPMNKQELEIQSIRRKKRLELKKQSAPMKQQNLKKQLDLTKLVS